MTISENIYHYITLVLITFLYHTLINEKNKVELDFQAVPSMLRGTRLCVGPEHQRWLVIEGGHQMTMITATNPPSLMLSQPALMSKKSHQYSYINKF